MLVRMNKRQFLFFYKPAHGLPVAGWDKISIGAIDRGEGGIKYNIKLWLYPYQKQAEYQGYCPHMD